MIITIREPTEAEMRQYLLRCGWREDKSAARARGDEYWTALNQTKDYSLDIYTAFIEAVRTAVEREVFSKASDAQCVTAGGSPLSGMERTYGEETVVQKTGAVGPAAVAPTIVI